VGYATGKTDEFRGTGVWNGVQLKREGLEDDIKMDNNGKTLVSRDTTSKPEAEKKETVPK
jgi:hypothetical protein